MIKEKIAEIENEIAFFGGKDFALKEEWNLQDEGELIANMKFCKLEGYREALKDVKELIEGFFSKFSILDISGGFDGNSVEDLCRSETEPCAIIKQEDFAKFKKEILEELE